MVFTPFTTYLQSRATINYQTRFPSPTAPYIDMKPQAPVNCPIIKLTPLLEVFDAILKAGDVD